jgi:cytochrome c oxidase cbb3-type subunit 3
MQATKKSFLLSLSATIAIPVLSFGAEANPLTKSPEYNTTLISLVSLIVVLLFVIGILAATLSQLSVVVRDKFRKERSEAAKKIGMLLLLVGLCLPAAGSFAAETAPAAVVEYIDGIPTADFYLIMGIIALELFVIFALVIFTNMLMKAMRETPETEVQVKKVVEKSWFWDKFNAAATIEKEQDILLDHNYDGIMELDNSLPPWWKYGFYLTIVVGVIYFYRFHISHDGPSQQEEFAAEMIQGEADKAAYLAQSANNVDENSVTLMTGAAEIAAGRELFQKSCVACHLADGGGSVGPNLVDDYWIHGGSIKDIFKTIKYGWQDKGMKSWKDDFSPKEIQELTSFIKSIRGTKPAAPKAPQGDLYVEATPVAAVADSVVNDTTAVKK